MNPALWITLDRGGSVSCQDQLVHQLRSLILTGQLPEAEPIASTRALACSLQLGRSVVVRAYEQLIGEGYLEAVPGSATRVTSGIITSKPDPRLNHAPARDPDPDPDPDLVASRAASHNAAPLPPPIRIDLRTGAPFTPAEVPADWRQALSVAARQPLSSQAPDPQGNADLREQIALHVNRARGMRCRPEDVFVTTGTSAALGHLALALGADSRVAVEDPGYPEAVTTMRLAGMEVTPIPVSADGMRASGLAALSERTPPQAVLVTPSHQFPLGGHMPATERTALIDWAIRHGSVLIEDDYDSEFRYVGAPLPALAALDPGGVVAHIGSLNKTFSPSVRCGYLIVTAHTPLWLRISAVRAALGADVSAVMQTALTTLLRTGALRRYMAKIQREYRDRRGRLLRLAAEAGVSDRLSGLDGGLHAMLRVPGPGTASEFAEMLAQIGIAVEPVAAFTIGRRADDAIALGYGAVPGQTLETGLREVFTLAAHGR